MFNLSRLADRERHLFQDQKPADLLYHYTSLPAFVEIVKGRCLRLSDVRYMNDASEISYTLDLIRRHTGGDPSRVPLVSNDDAAAFLIDLTVRSGTYCGLFHPERQSSESMAWL